MPYLSYFLFPFVVWLVSQTIKFFIRLGQRGVPGGLRDAWWTYLWAGGMPSTHTAILVSALVVVWYKSGPSPISLFCLAITMLRLYDLLGERKKFELLNSYFKKTSAPGLQNIVTDGFVLDLSGHTFAEVFWGAMLGLGLGLFAILFQVL